MHATDRQIIERLLIPTLMQVVIISMRRSLGDDAGVLDPISDLLGEALREPVEGLPPERVAKIVRRSKRATERAMAAVVDKVFGVQYLAIARFTADLAERGVIVIGAESPFARAWDMMAEVIGLGWDELEKCDADATVAAHELGRILAELGFYRAERS
jgi:hypothetical protein